MDPKFTRRGFLKGAAATGALTLANGAWAQALRYFKPLQIENPLAAYPNRDWEFVYRNIFKHDSEFHFLCAPNDTHNCLLKTFVKNDVAVRIGPSYGYGKAEDLYGNKASHRWDPRLCQKGLGLIRRVYGDRRVKGPMVRRGFKDWVDAGFPRDAKTGKPDAKYFQRGKDKWLRLKWEDAYKVAAAAMANIAKNYSGEEGKKKLLAQGYDSAMVESTEGAGTQTFKLRGGMAAVGLTRIFALYRLCNSLALIDDKIRKVGADHAVGGRGWDSYSWHTDTPPGHAMVTGITNEFELFTVEHSKLLLCWGMNWISTKMPDSHWLTEARIKGTKVVVISADYSSTASKADELLILKPGTDIALALGMAQVVISKGIFDKDFVISNTDLPFLIREDTLQPLRPSEIIKGYVAPELTSIEFLKKGQKGPSSLKQEKHYASESLKDAFEASVVWDKKSTSFKAVTRDMYGKHFLNEKIDVDLRASKEVTLLSGKKVKVRTSFSFVEEYLNKSMKPAQVSLITGLPAKAIVSLAQQIAKNKEKTLFACGMGTNQFFNADLKDRAVYLLASLTKNVGFVGGNVGSFSGNYRFALAGGEPFFAFEDPFKPQLDKSGEVSIRKSLHYESLHWFNYGDRPLKSPKKMFTGATHMPSPTKFIWLSNSNSVLGNAKWKYDVLFNTLPKVEMVCVSDWWWTASCEYSDIVWGVDSWAEHKQPDMVTSCTNPFVQMFPVTPLPKIFDTKSDMEAVAGVSRELAKIFDEPRLEQMWKFSKDDRVDVYLQRIIDKSPGLSGYKFKDLAEKCEKGIPSLFNNRTYPRGSSYEETKSERPWYTKSGRLELYRQESEFIDAGENLPIYREPIDSTQREPNLMVGSPHVAIRHKTPKDYGMSESDLSSEARQIRNVMVTPEELVKTKHPLRLKMYTHIYHTPKYRHGVHSTPVDTDYVSVWFGPFGDIYRHDKRMPSVTEGYVDINPLDAKALGIEDGDYVHVDADPEDRPYRDWKKGTEEHKVARMMLRARYYPGTPRGVARSYYNMYGATHGSVKGHETRPDGLASSPETNYRSMFRYGSHQSATRAWLKPTLMTDSLIHKDNYGHSVVKGFTSDIHCPVGAPREAFVKITKAEAGGIGGKGKWRPAQQGFRPSYESKAMKNYLAGGFMKTTKKVKKSKKA
jgi:nitrate reductase alpha subunit